MLRVGLTGGLGSGKSTIAQMFAVRGVHVISADEVGRRLMQPGESVYREIVAHFGAEVIQPNETLNRRLLADLAFRQGRLDELNRIVHPAVIAAQERWMEEIAAREPDAIAMIESAIIFEAGRTGSVPGWHDRFDCILLVTAPDEMKIARYLDRLALPDAATRATAEKDARARIASQIPDGEKIPLSTFVIDNSGSLGETEREVDAIFAELLGKKKTFLSS